MRPVSCQFVFSISALPLQKCSFNFLTSLLYPPVSYLIIEDDVCLWGALQYLLIKDSVCACLFISCCYSQRSPGAMMRHNSPVPMEACTANHHCSTSHSEQYQNEFLSVLFNLVSQFLILSYSTYSTYILLYQAVQLFRRHNICPFVSICSMRSTANAYIELYVCVCVRHLQLDTYDIERCTCV